MKSKKLCILFICVIIVIFLFLKLPFENKDLSKFNELNDRISEIEKLIKLSRKSFEVIKKALMEMKNNGSSTDNLNNVKSLLKMIQSKEDDNQSRQTLKWSKQSFKMCPLINVTKCDIDLYSLKEKLDFKDIDGGVWKQGFDIKYDLKFPQKLKIFIVPHSHLDPGWIKTISEYFDSQTKPILDSMLQFLIKEPEMKFIHAEISYFQMWWETLSEKSRVNVKKLVSNRQLELVTGGWVMTDEANSHYYSMLNQLIDGHVWLKKHLDYSPNTSWSIDPFGYSQLMPYILKKSNINNLVIQRVHYIVKKELASKKQLEFLWTQPWDTKRSYSMPCQIMPFYSYDVPHTCGPDPRICCQFDFIRKFEYGCPWGKIPIEITDDNIEERAATLMDQYRKKSELYDNGNILLIPLGDDFRYKSLKEWSVQFYNYKKLMKYMNDKKEWNIEIKFSTLSEYFEAFNIEKVKQLPTLSGNLFTYADRLDHYWSGYFTTRPLQKSLDRILMTNLRTAEIVLSLSLIYQQKYKIKSSTVFNGVALLEQIEVVRRTLSMFQHHDAITGTSKNHVVEDYGNKLITAINMSKNIFLQSAQGILEKNVENLKLNEVIFDLDEVIETYGQEKVTKFVDFSASVERYVYLFNSLAQPRQVVVNIPIKGSTDHGMKVTGSGNQIMQCQLTPFTNMDDIYQENLHVISFKLNIGPLAFEQVKIMVSQDAFQENNCLPVEIHVYSNKHMSELKIGYKMVNEPTTDSSPLVMKNLVNTLHISQSTGSIEKIVSHINSNIMRDFRVNFKHYGARKDKEMSGAYIFLPDDIGKDIEYERFPPITHFKGNVFDEVHVKYKYVTQKIKMYHVDGMLANAIDIENIVDIRQSDNFELSMSLQIETPAPSNVFYTDSNCFQFIKRKTLSKLPIQGNVYPMPCGAYVESHSGTSDMIRMSVFSKQPNGVMGGKIKINNKMYSFLEIFQDRRLNQDDNRGLFEPVTDNKVTSLKYRVVLESWKISSGGKEGTAESSYLGELSITSHQLLNDLLYPVHGLYVKMDLNHKVSTNLVSQKSLLTGLGLPCDHHLVNLRTDDDGHNSNLPKLILHRTKLNCDGKYLSEGSCVALRRKSVLFKSMFDDLTIKHIHKASLTGVKVDQTNFLPEDISVDLMNIDTFILQFDSK